MTLPYQQRQQQLQARADELKAQHPYLTPRPATGGAIPGGVAANVRKFFQHLWPEVPCHASTDRWANGTAVEFEYTTIPSDPGREEVLHALKVFQNQRYQSDTETFSPDVDFEREAFRKAFGGGASLSIREMAPTVKQRQSRLNKKLPAGDRTRKGPRF